MKILGINNYGQTKSSNKTNNQLPINYATDSLQKDTVSFTGKTEAVEKAAKVLLPEIDFKPIKAMMDEIKDIMNGKIKLDFSHNIIDNHNYYTWKSANPDFSNVGVKVKPESIDLSIGCFTRSAINPVKTITWTEYHGHINENIFLAHKNSDGNISITLIDKYKNSARIKNYVFWNDNDNGINTPKNHYLINNFEDSPNSKLQRITLFNEKGEKIIQVNGPEEIEKITETKYGKAWGFGNIQEKYKSFKTALEKAIIEHESHTIASC